MRPVRLRAPRPLPNASLAWLALAALLAPLTLGAQAPYPLTTGQPEEVGLSSAVLDRIAPAMQELIDAGRTAGVVTLVARRGTIVHWDAHGWRVLGEDRLERDDIFRIYSMTKPVTSVAVMMLVEEGRLALDTPLADVIPAFRGQQVWDAGRLRAPASPILIRHLLTHTSGLGYGDIGRTPVDSLYREARLGVWGSAGDLEATVSEIASLPLIFDPGTRWNYSLGVDVLGRVVEVVSGRSLDDFFRTRIFAPLGMDDTGFSVPVNELDDFTAVYGPGQGGLQVIESPVDGQHTRPAQWLSGGGGLTSTAGDYLRFAQMLLNEGELHGARLLRPETVRLMRSNHLPDELVPIGIGGADQGFGLGFAVSMGENAGSYRWLGIAGTFFWIDPTEEMIVFAWNQLRPSGGAPIERVMAGIAYEAVAAGTAGPPLIQPGAPGDPSRVVRPEDVALAGGPSATEADTRFMQRMIPHHAQALEMTALVAQRASGPAVRAMALRMQISQRDEIALIEQWLRGRGHAISGSHGNGHATGLMPGMLTPEQMSALGGARGSRFDRLFLELMIQHHEGAITMVEELFGSSGAGQVSEIFQFASEVEADQRMEIDRMRRLLEGDER
ncbi:MAG TPA: serine hydrolase [Longimicrobiales bacterium]|nr:serine hydrolase [Longimicrobiales bacterium]